MACSLTKTGGKIGVNPLLANLAITKFIIANCNKTKSHFIYQNLAPLTSEPFSTSIQPFFSPISQCSFGFETYSLLLFLKLYSIIFSLSVSQIAVVGSSKFGN
jgi:hypothetical protein